MKVLNHLLTFAIFLVIGIEIRDGLSHIKAALLPIYAALGGMIFPALIFKFLQPESSAWAVVMPTDVALALGVLAIIGKKAPASARLFLMTLAVADDFFSLLVIGVFYRSDLKPIDALFTLGAALIGAVVPYRAIILKYLNPIVSFAAVPLYIWINLFADLNFTNSDFALPSAIIAARVFGKALGIFLISYLLVKSGRMRLPHDLNHSHIFGVGLLCGMGMTVSLVIAEITVHSQVELNEIRTGLFIAAIVSALLAMTWFRVFPGSVFVLDELRNNQ